MTINDTFRAYMLELENGELRRGVQTLSRPSLPDGELTIRVHYSSINYKDGLAHLPQSPIVKSYPFIPGVDLAGVVEVSEDPGFRPGDPVIVTGHQLGVSHYGGFSELARVPAAWAVPLPDGLTLREAMGLGTAGFTAALSVLFLERAGLRPGQEPVLVTGATGGVGSVAVSILGKLGYEVTASTGKAAEAPYLHALGAGKVIDRTALLPTERRPLTKQRWSGAVDPVGGPALPYILSAVRYGGAVALSGLTGGPDFEASVFPFILRGVQLLGVDSVFCDAVLRTETWTRLARDWKPDTYLAAGTRDIGLDELEDALGEIVSGRLRGRVVLNLI